MIIPSYLPSLNVNQFNHLFMDIIKPEIFETLCISARNGDFYSIEALNNIALRQDAIGPQAENELFDLFSGNQSEKKGSANKIQKGVDSEIQKASLALYNIALYNRTKNNNDMQKLHAPSKLLYIAGSTLTNITEKQALSMLLIGNQSAQSPNEQLGELDIWGENRMLQTDEINATTKKIARGTPDISINFPIGITHSHDNMLNEIIEEKQKDKNFLNQPELFPINTGNHWILFMLYKDLSDNKVKNIVFNSYHELDQSIKVNLIRSAKNAGLTEESDITFIERNIQDNAPNGCGLFVVKAIELICQTPEQNPEDKLKSFTQEFVKKSIEEQRLFNQQIRRQLYGVYHDDIFYKTKETERL